MALDISKKRELIERYRILGEQWINGEIDIEEFQVGKKHIVLNKKQIKFVNSKKRYCLMYGGYGGGKTLTLVIKMILHCLFFPKNLVLLGRKTLQDVERTTLTDLFDLLPTDWYKHHVKSGTIEFFNGSKIILFGLDALQQGSLKDIKKAQQKIKSLNLGAYFIDQLEEIEEEVFKTLNSRLRRTDTQLRQGNMTCNPANFWAYNYFIVNPDKNTDLDAIGVSMLDNKDNLPEDYIQDQMKNDEMYVRRYVYGEWSTDLLVKGTVFPAEYISQFKPKKPIAIEEGCEIYEQPRRDVLYQMGVDPSEGAVDPSSISVVSEEGVKVARFNAKIPIFALGDKVKFLYGKYREPLIIPEVNAAGQALLLQIRDLNVYKRTIYDYKFDKQTEKLGWKTTHQSKQSLINNFKELLKNKFVHLYDKGTIEELKSFVWSDEAKKKGAGAPPGYHDDDVMSTMLAFWGLTPKKIYHKKNRIIQEQIKAVQNRYKFQYY